MPRVRTASEVGLDIVADVRRQLGPIGELLVAQGAVECGQVEAVLLVRHRLRRQCSHVGAVPVQTHVTVHAHPRPANVRIVVGGHSPAAFRRAVSRGHGWFGNGGPDDLPRHLAGLRRAAEEVERPAHLGRLEVNYLQLDPVRLDRDDVDRYASQGVDRLIVYPLPLEDPDEVARFLEHHATLV